MKKIFYWSPCLNRVGTLYSTINSAISIKKYSNSTFEPIIINSCGEWDNYLEIFNKYNIKVKNFYRYNYFKYLPKQGFISSRLSYLIIYIFSFIPLLKLIQKNKNEILIAHLITSLPLSLAIIFNIKTKLILRISGYPKLNFIRYFLWKLSNFKISYITCPSQALLEKLKNMNLFDKNKLTFLPDAIININEIKSQLFENKKKEIKYILAVGRLTKQKNFTYLINEFDKFLKVNKNFKLIILGEGDEKEKLKNICKSRRITDHVEFKGQVNNVYSYMKQASVFVLSSLWEEPGFVIIEAGFCNLFVISSDCENGPIEFLNNGKGGILFESNKENSLFNSLAKFENMKNEEILIKKINLKKKTKDYSIFTHFKILNNILDENKI
tara:strand:+ start:89 stop:1237 length:1149 start_codon:yes stop_codon:yes gene_type:complete